MKPDAILRLRFSTTAEGGRSAAVQGPTYSCPLVIDSFAFDCRLIFSEDRLDLGSFYEVGVKSLDSAGALSRLTAGTKVSIWEGRIVGWAEVLTVFSRRD